MPRKPAAKTQEPTDADSQIPEGETAVDPAGAGPDAGPGDGQDAGDGTGTDTDTSGEGAAVSSAAETVRAPRIAPSQETSGRVLDTTTSDLVPPGSAQDLRTNEATGDSDYHVLRLAEYLRENFPSAMEVNRQFTEHPVDVAIRLLAGLASKAPEVVERCAAEYCNRPKGHTDEHGWTNYGG